MCFEGSPALGSPWVASWPRRTRWARQARRRPGQGDSADPADRVGRKSEMVASPRAPVDPACLDIWSTHAYPDLSRWRAALLARPRGSREKDRGRPKVPDEGG